MNVTKLEPSVAHNGSPFGHVWWQNVSTATNFIFIVNFSGGLFLAYLDLGEPIRSL